VVDDNSPDGTGAVVRARREYGRSVFLLARPGKQGLGAAYRAGFAWALERGYAAVVQMDGDLSHPPERLPTLIGALADADVAVGSRYVAGGGVRNWAWHRRLISRAGNLYVALVLGLRTRDATAGFKAFRRRALLEIGATTAGSDGYSFQIENAWRARRRGLRVAEVPITFTDRRAGTSKMSGSIVSEAVLRVLGWRVGELAARHRDLPAFLAVGGAGYVVDVLVFNLMLSGSDPALARVVAVVPAMIVTYLGNRLVTWRGRSGHDLRRELCLFLVCNAVGFAISVGTLTLSHDLLGLTSRLADNISANVIGLGLGTLFRYVTYRSLVFAPQRHGGRRTSTTLARCTSWWSTTRNAWSRSCGTTSTRSARRRTDATTG
jgi:dolichol-phosphate mannosyltransferase